MTFERLLQNICRQTSTAMKSKKKAIHFGGLLRGYG
jgi:hypothetical protein